MSEKQLDQEMQEELKTLQWEATEVQTEEIEIKKEEVEAKVVEEKIEVDFDYRKTMQTDLFEKVVLLVDMLKYESKEVKEGFLNDLNTLVIPLVEDQTQYIEVKEEDKIMAEIWSLKPTEEIKLAPKIQEKKEGISDRTFYIVTAVVWIIVMIIVAKMFGW